MKNKKIKQVSTKTNIKEAYDLYVKESREEADRLFNQGCMVNYREFSYQDFVEVGSDKQHRWYCFFPEKFKQVFAEFV